MDRGSVVVRALGPDDVSPLVALRRRALNDKPLSFAASVEDDRGLDPEAMRSSIANADSSAVFGAFMDDQLVGMVGVVRDRFRKMRHKAIVWGVYVAPEARGSGIGTSLLEAAIQRACAWKDVVVVALSASEAAPEAIRLYERLGFVAWGTEPTALQWEGKHYAEVHYSLAIERD